MGGWGEAVIPAGPPRHAWLPLLRPLGLEMLRQLCGGGGWPSVLRKAWGLEEKGSGEMKTAEKRRGDGVGGRGCGVGRTEVGDRRARETETDGQEVAQGDAARPRERDGRGCGQGSPEMPTLVPPLWAVLGLLVPPLTCLGQEASGTARLGDRVFPKLRQEES